MRTDSEQQTAWTEGPWAVRNGTPEGGGQVWEITSPHAPDVNCNEVASSWENEPTARLIALAPEMAAAVLDLAGIYETNVGDENAAWDELYRIADRLRKIGATS